MALFALAITVLLLAAAAAATAQTITEFPLPTPPPNSGGMRITAGPDGALWFTALRWDKIGRITTAGAVTEFLIPETAPAGAIVTTNIAAGPDCALWFGFGKAVPDPTVKAVLASVGIGRITTDGAISKYRQPSPASMPTFAIAAGPDGALWFAEQLANKIGRITTTGAIDQFPLPTPSLLSEITAGPDGALWFPQGGNKIGRITTDGAVTEFLLPLASRALTAGPDGALWFTAIGANKIGRIATDGVTKEFLLPTSNSGSGPITAGPDGTLWFTEANKIGRSRPPANLENSSYGRRTAAPTT